MTGAWPAQGQETSEALDAPYVDRSFGFSIRPPAGCGVFREKLFVGKADVELVRFAQAERQWYLSVRLSNTTRPLDTKMIVDGITERLSTFESVKVLRGESARIASREAVRYAASFFDKGVGGMRYQAVIRVQPTEYLAIIFVTPLGDAKEAEPLFERIVGSFELMRTEKRDQQVAEALGRGKSLLQRLASDRLETTQLARKEQYLRFSLDGKYVGFIEVREQATTVDKRPGIEFLKNVWVFMPKGSITYLQNTMFLSADLAHERWDNRLVVLDPPGKKGEPGTVTFDFESGIRQDNQLLVKYASAPNSDKVLDKAIEVEKTYAPVSWDLLFPRLVDLKKGGLYAFSSYDTARRGLQLRAYRLIGSKRVVIGGRPVTVVRIEESEGLIPPVNEIDVDEKGQVLRVVAPSTDTEMVATTRAHVDVKYGQRVKEALATFDRLAKERSKMAR
jgi:hypothetical protein